MAEAASMCEGADQRDLVLSALRLPPILRIIAERAGVDATLRLAQDRGGTRVYVPLKIEDGHWLAECLGMDGACALVKLYAGETISIPFGPNGSLNRARRLALQSLAEGASVAQAALASGLTERTIYNLRKRGKV